MKLELSQISIGDSFCQLGRHLFSRTWDGYEIWGRKSADPADKLEARAPLEERLEETFLELKSKKEELRNALTLEEIQSVNNDIANLKTEQGQIFAQLHEIGEVRRFEVEDRGRWDRFDSTESYLLRALRNGDLVVQCFMGQLVKAELWQELPVGFGFDWELSLIFLPSNESAKRVNSGRIDAEAFELWLRNIIPFESHDGANMTEEQKAVLWFKDEIAQWDGKTTKAQFREMALSQFGISRRCFDDRIWGNYASDGMKKPGAKT